ncbi:DUF3558 domain-containing protein [Amycolatopsis sp. DSM 110486]|uniref:DUF3558 domain-containing protein n=1 Tax=Amycolatopsis sp. DSM 110486 TaxID=2865832 RepID=UPI001C69B642|nr:DUF3558 domain-containing protein [Amycolatopsis sp. DSM 110486]QYN18854.1 DUF3558 domain-containing protein [Amycolatopsis sp. DSM 110486]
MISRNFVVTCGSVVVAVVLAGCSSGSPNPNTSPSASAPTDSAQNVSLPYAGAPKVSNPLQSSLLGAQPCQEGLTSSQLTDVLGKVVAGSPTTTAGLGPSCTWTNSEKGSSVDVAYDTATNDGLSSWYQNTKPKAVVWQPTQVQGFPAVAHVTNGGAPDEFCQVTIGINDQRTIDVSVGLGPAKKGKLNPCQAAEQVADMVMTNLRQKAGS